MRPLVSWIGLAPGPLRSLSWPFIWLVCKAQYFTLVINFGSLRRTCVVWWGEKCRPRSRPGWNTTKRCFCPFNSRPSYCYPWHYFVQKRWFLPCSLRFFRWSLSSFLASSILFFSTSHTNLISWVRVHRRESFSTLKKKIPFSLMS